MKSKNTDSSSSSTTRSSKKQSGSGVSKTYTCPISGRVYKTRRGAKASEAREKEKIDLSEYFKNNCGTIYELTKLLSDKSKELFGWEIVVREYSRAEIVTFPSGEGIRFNLKFFLNLNKKVSPGARVIDHITGKFPFIRTYWTCWTTFREQESRGYCSVDFVVMFKDFPLMKENRDLYILQCEEKKKYEYEEKLVLAESRCFTQNLDEYKDQLKVVKELEGKIFREKEKLYGIEKFNIDEYKLLWQKAAGEPPEVDESLHDMFGLDVRRRF
jgi:hypothetical protein